MQLAIVTILLFAVFAVSPCTANAPLERGIRQFLEQYRLNMPCGIPEHGIPVLAPLRRARKPVNIRFGGFVFRGNLINFYAGQLDTFVVRNVRLNVNTLRLEIELFYPHVTTSGRFTQGVGQAPGNCRIQGDGTFTLRANGLTQRMTSSLLRRGSSLQLGEMTTRVTINSFQSNIQHFLGTQQQSNACNANLQQQMPRIFANQQATISRYFENMLRPIANRALRNMTLQDLMDLVRGHGRPPVPCRPRRSLVTEIGAEDDDEELMIVA